MRPPLKRLRRSAPSLVLILALFSGIPALAADANANYRAALESINAEQIRGFVTYLADDALEGRESGTKGNREAGEFIAGVFRDLGLEPGGEGGSYFQGFPPNYRNILAILRGRDPELAKEHIIVGAHYDHVGYGNRRNSAGPIGQIHNGADDNASGVSAILELAEALHILEPRPKRTIVFAAWDAEEMGLLGSKHWVSRPTIPLDKIVLCVNVDMVGRLRNDRLFVHGVRSGTGLRRLLARGNAEAGLLLDFAWGIPPIADHYPFFTGGVPVVTVHSGQHEHYHTPYDDSDLVDMGGIRHVSRFLFAVVSEAANANQTPRYRSAAARESRSFQARLGSHRPNGPPRLGVRWRGAAPLSGVLVEGAAPRSPADECGLRPGDRILRVAQREIHAPDDFPGAVATAPNLVTISVARGESEEPVELTARLRGEPLRLGISWNEDDAEPGTLLLTDVIPGTVAAEAGLRKGDRILTLAGEPFASADEFVARCSRLDTDANVEIERDGRIETKTVRFDATASREEI